MKQSRIILFKEMLDFTALPEELLDEVAGGIGDYMKSITPWGDTGQLKRSIGIRKRGEYAREIGFNEKRRFDRIPLLSIKPFEIRYKKTQALRWKVGKGFALVTQGQNPSDLKIIERADEWGKNNIPAIITRVMVNYPKEE